MCKQPPRPWPAGRQAVLSVSEVAAPTARLVHDHTCARRRGFELEFCQEAVASQVVC